MQEKSNARSSSAVGGVVDYQFCIFHFDSSLPKCNMSIVCTLLPISLITYFFKMTTAEFQHRGRLTHDFTVGKNLSDYWYCYMSGNL